MRIVISGGFGKPIFNLARSVASRGHEVHYFVFSKKTQRIIIDGVHIHQISTPFFPPLRGVVKRLYLFFQYRSFDLVHVNSAFDSIIAWLARITFKKPFVLMTYGYSCPELMINRRDRCWHRLEALLLPWMARRATAVIAVSEYVQRELKQRYNVESFVFYQGVNEEEFNPKVSGEKIRQMYGGPIVLYVGRLNHDRDPVTFIQSIPIILREVPKTKFILIGEGPLFQFLITEVKKLGIDHTTFLCRRVSQINEYFAAANIFVQPAIRQAYSLVLLEAMACGTPIVVAATGAAFEMVGGIASFFKPGDPLDLAQKVIYILKNSDFAEELRFSGLKRVQEKFLWDATVNTLMEIYRKAISRNDYE